MNTLHYAEPYCLIASVLIIWEMHPVPWIDVKHPMKFLELVAVARKSKRTSTTPRNDLASALAAAVTWDFIDTHQIFS